MSKLTPTGRISKSLHLNSKKEYQAWSNMKARCYKQNNKDYKNYGARGIKMCDEWRQSFKAFLDDVGEAPGKEYTIDRIGNNGNYEPGNVRWATKAVQANNKRNSIIINYDGQTKTLTEWSKYLKISYSAAHRAIKLHQDVVGIDQAFIDWLAPKSRLPIYKEGRIKALKEPKIYKRQPPKYYHDLQSVVAKYNLSPLGFR